MTVEMADTIAALKAWCSAGTGIGRVVLENEALDQDEAQYVEIKILDDVEESSSIAYEDRTSRLIPRVDVTAKMSVQISVISDSQDPDAFSLGYLRALRAFAKVDRMREILAAGRLVLIGVELASNNDEQDADDRWISRFAAVATFRNAYSVTGDFTLDAKSWIEKVNGSGTLEGTDIEPTISVDIHPED